MKIKEEILNKVLEFSREVTFEKGAIILEIGEPMKNEITKTTLANEFQ